MGLEKAAEKHSPFWAKALRHYRVVSRENEQPSRVRFEAGDGTALVLCQWKKWCKVGATVKEKASKLV